MRYINSWEELYSQETRPNPQYGYVRLGMRLCEREKDIASAKDAGIENWGAGQQVDAGNLVAAMRDKSIISFVLVTTCYTPFAALCRAESMCRPHEMLQMPHYLVSLQSTLLSLRSFIQNRHQQAIAPGCVKGRLASP